MNAFFIFQIVFMTAAQVNGGKSNFVLEVFQIMKYAQIARQSKVEYKSFKYLTMVVDLANS